MRQTHDCADKFLTLRELQELVLEKRFGIFVNTRTLSRWLRQDGAPRALGPTRGMRKRYSLREFSEWIEDDLMVARVKLTEPGPKNKKCLLGEEMGLGHEATARQERGLPPLVVLPRARDTKPERGSEGDAGGSDGTPTHEVHDP